MKIFETMNKVEYDLPQARLPITVVHGIVYLITIFIQFNASLSWQQLILSAALFLLYNSVHWYSDWLLVVLKSGYFFLLGFIQLGLLFLMPESTIILVLGLMPVFIAQGIFYYEEKWRGITLVIGYYVFGCLMIYSNYAFEDLLIFMILCTSMLALLAIVILMFKRQQIENKELQYYIEELETANRKIEQLTLKNERQRMARDLHDTLAQRLVGLVLKLEASESHLQQGHVHKSAAIIQSAILQAKQSVQESRNVIDDLRKQESMRSFYERIQEEVEELQQSVTAAISLRMDRLPELPVTMEEHIVSIIRESAVSSSMPLSYG